MLRLKNFSLRLARDERGNVAVMFGLMAVPLMLFVGGAVDFGTAMREQSKLQSAADAAALSAASEINATNEARISKGEAIFAANNTSQSAADVQPDISVTSSNVTVTAETHIPTSFLTIMHIDDLEIKAHSTAKWRSTATTTESNGQKICLLALDPQSNDGIHIQGNNEVNYQDCWGYTNSVKPTAINAVGSVATALGAGHCAVGGYVGEHNNFSPAPKTSCPTVADPFARVGAYELTASYSPTFTPPAVPATCKSQNLNLKKGTYTLDPGRYCGGMNFQAHAAVTLNPGIYIIDDGLFNVQSGASVTGTNVIFYFRGANARMTMIGGGTVNLKGRSSGSSYEGFLFIAHPDAWRGLESNIQGGGTFNLEGLLYMPTQRIEVAGYGDVNNSSRYFGMVAKDFYFRGNGKFTLKKYGGDTTLADKMPNLPQETSGDPWLSQ